MIARYQSKVFESLWSDQTRYEKFLAVELATAYAWQQLGLFDEQTFKALSKASFELEDIYELEKETKHDVIAFTRTVSNSLGDEKKWIHYGLTSTDVVDSAQALILKEVNIQINKKIDLLLAVLKEKALLYKELPSIGRTHGIHAELTSFGLKFSLWYADLKRIKQHFDLASKNVEVIKISGAVGNYAAGNPLLEYHTAKYLDLPSADISTQVLQRDRHAAYIASLALIGSELEKIATEIRHLSRTEVGEASEYFAAGQKGSSAMPHKKNPIASENISGLSRVLRGYVVTAYENMNLWHERDISHSSAERIILADSTTLIDYMLNRMTILLTNLVVDEIKIKENINLTQGVVFSGHILSLLIQKGFSRELAYDNIQSLALKALQDKTSFIELIYQNKTMMQYVTVDEIKAIIDPHYLLRHVDLIYQKIF